MLQTVLINQENLGAFENLLPAKSISQIKANVPIIALGYVDDYDVVVGAAVGNIYQRVFNLESFFIADNYRHLGYGINCLNDIEWMLRDSADSIEARLVMINDEIKQLSDFLENCGFTKSRIYPEYYSMQFSEIDKLKIFARKSTNKNVHAFKEFDSTQLWRYAKILQESNAPIPETGIDSMDVDKDLSMLYVENDKPVAFILFHINGAKLLTQSELWNGSDNPSLLLSVLIAAVDAGREKLDGSEIILFQPINDTSDKLMKYILTNTKSIGFRFTKNL